MDNDQHKATVKQVMVATENVSKWSLRSTKHIHKTKDRCSLIKT
jgi:hypothetical protein